ncbi:hypothetical protein J8J27_35320, partial [Mycobacterium tuberculosis]|nr:hypothetical protein [Mycobacterium tuberculosis]
GRPWQRPGYGLGLMMDGAAPSAFGHTGGGPGSVVAVYHDPAAAVTRAAFLPNPRDDAAATGRVEHAAIPQSEQSA